MFDRQLEHVLFFTLQCKRMYFQSRKLTNIFYFGGRFFHSLAKKIATKHPRALTDECICAYNRIGRTQLGNYLFFGFQSERNICAIILLRDHSSNKLINFLDSQLDTRDSRLDPRDSILETIKDQVSRLELEDQGSSDCQLTFERYCSSKHSII